jgi:hypothetical protein
VYLPLHGQNTGATPLCPLLNYGEQGNRPTLSPRTYGISGPHQDGLSSSPPAHDHCQDLGTPPISLPTSKYSHYFTKKTTHGRKSEKSSPSLPVPALRIPKQWALHFCNFSGRKYPGSNPFPTKRLPRSSSGISCVGGISPPSSLFPIGNSCTTTTFHPLKSLGYFDGW